jgi:hypothetical protein
VAIIAEIASSSVGCLTVRKLDRSKVRSETGSVRAFDIGEHRVAVGPLMKRGFYVERIRNAKSV